MCEHCGGKLVQYKQTLSRGLVNALVAFARKGRKAHHLSEVRFTYNQRNNFQKLRYWRMVRKAGIDRERSGYWEITRRGWEFLAEERAVPAYVRTFRAEVVAVSKRKVYVTDIPADPFYLKHGDYVAGSREHKAVRA